MLAIAAAGDADVGLARFARAINDAAQYRERHRGLYMTQRVFEFLHRADDVEALSRARGAADHADAAGAKAQRFQDFIADADFFLWLRRQGNADRVANPRPEQIAHANRGFDRPANQPASLGDAKVQRAVDRFGQPHIGGDREEHIRRLHRDLIFVEIAVLQKLDMVKRAFNQGVGARLTVLLQQILFETACIHADADCTTIGLGGVDDLVHPLCTSNIARVDAKTRGASVCRLQRAFIMEVDVGNDRDICRADNLFQRSGAFNIGAGNANNIDACILTTADLVDGRTCIAGQRVGHGLHRYRRIAANGNITDHDLAGWATRYIAPRAYGRHGGDIGGVGGQGNCLPDPAF